MPRARRDARSLCDLEVGARVRLARQERGISLERLAASIGISAKQVQKYETGADQIFPSRLQQIANVFELPIGVFFDETTSFEASILQIIGQPDAIRVAKAFHKIRNMAVRKRITRW